MKLHKLTLLAASALLLLGAGCENAAFRAGIESASGTRQDVREQEGQERAATATPEEGDDGLKADVGAGVRVEAGGREREEGDENEREDDGDDDDRGGVSPAPAPTPAPAPSGQTYTMAQVKAHASASSCWTAINGSVYDVTGWIAQHPGGEAAILSLCGIDGSAAFDGQHGGQSRPASELAGFKIGLLVK
jgi:cytochrome b involved in lipid metabolism